MGISGGAIIPPLYGAIEDAKFQELTAQGAADAAATAATGSYWILLPCYAVILYYAFHGHKLGVKEWYCHLSQISYIKRLFRDSPQV